MAYTDLPVGSTIVGGVLTIPVGDVAISIGNLKLRVKAMNGNNAGLVLSNSQAFTVTPQGGGTDPDALTYITAVEATGYTMSQGEKDAWNNFVIREKAASRYSKYTALFPIIGASAAAHAINAVAPGTGNLTFNGNWSHTASGMKITDAPMGAAVAETTIGTGQDSNSVGVYINEDLGTFGYDFGNVGNGGFTDMGRFNGTQYFHNAAAPDHSVSVVDDIKGLQLITRTTSSEFHHVGRGTATTFQQVSNTGTVTMGFGNINGLGSNSSQRRYGFAFVGQGLTIAEAQGLTTSMNTLQTDLNRA